MSCLDHFTWRRAARATLAGAAALAVAGVGAGCGGGSSKPSTTGGTPATSQDDTTLIVAQPEDLQNLDPTLSSGDQVTQEMLTNVYDWLVDYKVADQDGKQVGDANNFVGALAESMEWNASHTVLTFKLRKGLKFLNGNPIDAQAVKYTYDRVFDQKGVTASLISMAAVKDKNSITIEGDDTVKFHLDKANNLLLGNMAQFGNSILDPKVVEAHKTKADPFAHDWLSTNVDGGAQGPYQLQSWTAGSQWVLTVNPDYRGPEPKIQKIIFKVIPDPSTRYQLLQSGAVDIAYGLPLKNIAKAKSNPDIKIVNEPSRNIVFLGMNSKTKPFDNVKVRQADQLRGAVQDDHRQGPARLRPADDQPDPARHADAHRPVQRLQDRSGQGQGAARRGGHARRLLHHARGPQRQRPGQADGDLGPAVAEADRHQGDDQPAPGRDVQLAPAEASARVLLLQQLDLHQQRSLLPPVLALLTPTAATTPTTTTRRSRA